MKSSSRASKILSIELGFELVQSQFDIKGNRAWDLEHLKSQFDSARLHP